MKPYIDSTSDKQNKVHYRLIVVPLIKYLPSKNENIVLLPPEISASSGISMKSVPDGTCFESHKEH